jgi:hypothetical protein
MKEVYYTIDDIAVKDSVIYASGAIVLDSNPDHPDFYGQIWKCPLSSLH